MLVLKSISQRVIRDAGFNLNRYRREVSKSGRLVAMLSNYGINLVFDVSVVIGQGSQSLRAAMFCRN